MLVYIPALVMFVKTWQGTRSKRTQVSTLPVHSPNTDANLTIRNKRYSCSYCSPRYSSLTTVISNTTRSCLVSPCLFLHPSSYQLTVGIGFTLLAINFFATGNDLVAAVCFVLSLGFKQMALYYAPAIGSYLLAKCVYLGQKNGCVHLFLGSTAANLVS